MQNAALMRVMHSTSDLDQDGGDVATTFGIGQAVRNQLLNARAFDQLHAVKAKTVAFADFINGHDVGMIEPRRHARLQLETFASIGAYQMSRWNGLQSDQTSKATMACAIDHALASATQFAQKFVLAENGRGLGFVRRFLSSAGERLSAERIG